MTQSQQRPLQPTRGAVLTGVGRSAVAVIALRGPRACSVLDDCFRPAHTRPLNPGEVRFGSWHGNDPSITAESVVVTPVSDSEAEIHCHGGPAAVGRIVNDLVRAGVVEVPADRWQQSSDEPRLLLEARQVLSACTTPRTAAIALDQCRGALLDWAKSWLGRSAESETPPGKEFRDEVEAMLRFLPLSLRLAEPFRVVLAGPANVGKSSLVNALVGYQRSITYDDAGTTRDVLHAETVIDGVPIRFSDTAGIRRTDEEIEKEGISRAKQAVAEADLVVLVTAYASSSPGDQEDSDLPPPSAGQRRPLRVLNKVDLCVEMPGMAAESGGESAIPTVATSGRGIDNLMDAIIARLVPDIPPTGSPLAVCTRQAESLRRLASVGTRQAMRDQLRILIDGNSQDPGG